MDDQLYVHKSGRTRILQQKQSRGACATCKKRKLKCDEIRPICLRCHQSRLTCGGYARSDIAISSDFPQNGTSTMYLLANVDGSYLAELSPSLVAHIWANRLMKCGREPWQLLLSPFGLSRAASHACIAFGSALLLQDHLAPAIRDRLQKLHLEAYGHAVAQLQLDLEQDHLRQGSRTASLILATVEVLLRRRSSARAHVLAAFLAPQPPLNQDEAIPVRSLFREIDVGMMSYAWGVHAPAIEPRGLGELEELLVGHDPSSFTHELVIDLVHAGWTFISASCRQEAVTNPQVQMRILLRLLALVVNSGMTSVERHERGNFQSTIIGGVEGNDHLTYIVLRNLCLSLSALLPMLFSSIETAWNDFNWMFEEIIQSSEELLQNTSVFCEFAPQPGLIPSLYLAALKHRGSAWRARAVECLQRTWIEGPWNGLICAAIATRHAEIEAQQPRNHPLLTLAFAVESNGGAGVGLPVSSCGISKVKFVRRVEAGSFIEGVRKTSKQLGDERDSGWETWEEVIHFGPGPRRTEI